MEEDSATDRGATKVAPPGTDDGPTRPWVPFGGGDRAVASPATILDAPTSSSLAPGPDPFDRPDPRFSRFGRSPLPHLALAAVLSVVAWGVVRWMIEGGEAATSEGPPTWLARSVWAVVLQAAVFDPPQASTRIWWALAAVTAALLAVVAWARRVGQNARHEEDQYGYPLALAAIPVWFWLPVVLPKNAPTGLVEGLIFGDRSDALLRDAFTLILMLVCVGIGRFILAHRTWRAGNLPFEILATLLWLPMLVAYFWLLASTCLTLVQMGDDGKGSSIWRPTELSEQFAIWTGRVSYVGIVGLLAVVSVLQHVGLARDRRDDEQYHEEHAVG